MAGNEKVILDAGHGGCNLRDLKNQKQNSGLYAERGLETSLLCFICNCWLIFEEAKWDDINILP